MKKIAIAAAMVLSMSATAYANDAYVEVFGGVTNAPDLGYDGTDYAMENGWNIGGAFGVSVGAFEVEAEAFHTKSEYSGFDTNLNTTSIMGNVLMDFSLFGSSEVFVGAGLGAIDVEYDGEDAFPAFTDNELVFGWQLMGGLRFPIGDDISLFGEYRYQAAADAELAGVDVEYKSHNYSGGLRIEF